MSDKNDLERFVDEGIRIGLTKKYSPHRFEQMRARHGTIDAIKRLVISGDIQSGFVKMKTLDIVEWSLEAAVLNFEGLFGKEVYKAAAFRFDQLKNL